MPKITLNPASTKSIFGSLKKANAKFAKDRPGDSPSRQAVHTVYGGAHLFKADTAQKLGSLALRSLQEYAPDAVIFSEALGLSAGFAETVYSRVTEKLQREPVEDFRIDFEDGYGNRPDEEEDRHAEQSAQELARGMAEGFLPPFTGIRIKPLTGELYARSARTLDIFITTLAAASKRKIPSNFVVTLPKVTLPAHVAVLAKLLAALEARLKLPSKSLKIEIMVETPQAILGENGGAGLPFLIAAGGKDRCVSAHFGTYDYTALVNITAAYQSMVHPACDFAKHVMQVSLAQTGINLSDGATNIMPVPVHRAAPGQTLSPNQREENKKAVHRAWKLHFDHARHSLETGYYQGWDLHPAQLPTRYAAIYSFFLESFKEASVRLKSFVDQAAKATLVGDVFDDAATGQGLLNYFLRGLNCGAITIEEAEATGLTREDFQSRSFVKILNSKRNRTPVVV